MTTFKILVCALFVVAATRGKAQFQSTVFENSYKHLNSLNGLSNDFVNQAVKDKNGFVWIATQNGLNRYDGVHIKTFYHNPADANSICSNYVSALMADSRGRIWIGTASSGISVYDGQTQKFHSYLPNNAAPNQLRSFEFITSFYEDAQNRIWVTTWGSGLYLFDETTHGFEQFAKTPNQANSLYCNKVKSIIQDNSGRFWVGLWAEGPTDTIGIQIFDPQQKSFSNYYGFLKNKLGGELPKDLRVVLKFVHCLAIDKHNTLWIGGLLGMASIDLNDFSYKIYNQKDNRGISTINSKTIRCIAINAGNDVFAGSQGNGINILDFQTNKFSYISTNNESERSLSNNNIKHIWIDENQVYFVSTAGGGLNISLPRQQEFKFIHAKDLNIGGIPTGSGITAIGKSGENMLFSGKFGLIQWHTKTAETSRYLDTDAKNIDFSSNYISHSNKNGMAYISTNSNLYQLNTQTKKLQPIFWLDQDHGNKFANANTVVHWNKDSLLILTEFGGIDLFNLKSNRSTHIDLDSNSLGFWNSMALPDHDDLFAGYRNGVLKINLVRHTIQHLLADNIPKSLVKGWGTNSIYCDSKKRWWLACDSSLGLLHYPDKGYTMFPVKHNEMLISLLGIQEDERGNLWLHSDYEIYHFNTLTNTYTLLRSGLVKSNHQANKQSFLDPETGMFYVSSTEGIWVVDTRLYYNDIKLKAIVISDFYLNKGSSERNPAIMSGKELLLSYKQKFIFTPLFEL